jgi:uncharacterized protein YceK
MVPPFPGGGEMAFRAICGAVLLACLPAGCGTISNVVRPGPDQGGKQPFGGVHQDEANIRQAANGRSDLLGHPKPTPDPKPQWLPLALYALDLPLSFVGDVVTLPYVVSYSFINRSTYIPPLVIAPPVPPGGPAVMPPVTPPAGTPATLPPPTPLPPGAQTPPAAPANPPAPVPQTTLPPAYPTPSPTPLPPLASPQPVPLPPAGGTPKNSP